MCHSLKNANINAETFYENMGYLSIVRRRLSIKEGEVSDKTLFFLILAAAAIIFAGLLMIGYLLGRNGTQAPIIIEQGTNR